MRLPRIRKEGEMGRYCFMGIEFLFGMPKGIWKYIVVMVTQQCECNATKLYTSNDFSEKFYVLYILAQFFKIFLYLLPPHSISF